VFAANSMQQALELKQICFSAALCTQSGIMHAVMSCIAFLSYVIYISDRVSNTLHTAQTTAHKPMQLHLSCGNAGIS
jgi:hypothetical protein